MADTKINDLFYYYEEGVNVPSTYKLIDMEECADEMEYYLIDIKHPVRVKKTTCTMWGGNPSPTSGYKPLFARTKQQAYERRLKQMQERMDEFLLRNPSDM